MAVSEDSVEAELRVGMLDMALAKLLSNQHHTIEFPTLLLPENVEPGSIVRLTCTRAAKAELEDAEQFEKVQAEILDKFASNLPKTPVLRARNVTQTSVVLEWDPIDIASADLQYLALYKGSQRLGLIPNALKRTSMKVSNLEIDMPYTFRLVLSTSAGDFESEWLEVQTHKMSDLSGVVVCIGSLNHSKISAADIEDTLQRLGCKPAQSDIKLDTTHFLCTTEGGSQYDRAVELSIPIVRPEWLKACEAERKLVSVRGYYLSADPQKVPPVRERTLASPPTSSSEQQGSKDQPEEAQNGQDLQDPQSSQDPAAPVEKEGSAEPKAQNKNQHVRFDVPGEETSPDANGSAQEAPDTESNEVSGSTAEPSSSTTEHEADNNTPTGVEPASEAIDGASEPVSEASNNEHSLGSEQVSSDPAQSAPEPPIESADKVLDSDGVEKIDGPVEGVSGSESAQGIEPDSAEPESAQSEAAESTENPSPDSTKDSFAEPAAESVTEPSPEPVGQHAETSGPDSDAPPKPTNDSFAEPAAESVSDPTPDSATEPVGNSITEPAAEPVAIAESDTLAEPAAEPATEPATRETEAEEAGADVEGNANKGQDEKPGSSSPEPAPKPASGGSGGSSNKAKKNKKKKSKN